MVDDLPFKLMKTDRCVRQILRGVARNKADIVITPHGRLIYGMQRVAPWLAAHYAVRQATRARGARPTLADSD